MSFLSIFIHYLHEVIPAVLIGFFISGIIHELIPSAWVEKYLGRKGILPIAWATVIGTFLPVCCWGSLPIAVSLYKKGSRLGPILAFLVATPATSISALIVAYRLLGLAFTIYIFFSVILMGLIIGIMGNYLSYKPKDIEKIPCPHCDKIETTCECDKGFRNKVKGVFKFAFIEMPKDIGLEILIGIILAVAVEAFFPIGHIIRTYLAGKLAYLFSVVVGLIMYFCSTASVPLIHALIKQGMNPGAAYAMLLIGPVASYGTILVLRKEFGMKILLYFLISICLLSVIAGYIYEKFIFSSAG